MNISYKMVETVKSTIFIGSYDKLNKRLIPLEEGKKACYDFAFRKSICVSVTETEYIYTNGKEPGLIVQLINYPRFPKIKMQIEQLGEELAADLLREMCQHRCTIIGPRGTVMLTNHDRDVKTPHDWAEDRGEIALDYTVRDGDPDLVTESMYLERCGDVIPKRIR